MAHKVLICDDEEGVRESLKLVLGDDYDLILTENGAQCLECLRHAPDVKVAVLDIKMPQFNGLDLLVEIKKMRPQVQVIMITGYKSVETAAEATRRGAAGYIVKPFKSADVLEAVGRVVKTDHAA